MMRLEEYRSQEKLSYENLGRFLGMTTNKTYRLCKNDTCVKLQDAHRIVKKTKGQVDYPDMLTEGDC